MSHVNGSFARRYDDLLRVARRELKQGVGERLRLDGNALVHKAYVSISERRGFAFPGSFMAYAACVMRGLVLDEARKCGTRKRGPDLEAVGLDIEQVADREVSVERDEVGEALRQLEHDDPDLAAIVRWKIYWGLSFDEIASALSLSRRTVERRWVKALEAMRLMMGG